MQCYLFVKRLRIPIKKKKKKNQGVSPNAGKGSRLHLNASLQTMDFRDPDPILSKRP